MGTPLLTMPDVIYKTTLRDPGVPGVLILTESVFIFTPNGPSSSLPSLNLEVDFKTIEAQKCSKVGSKQALVNLIKYKGGNYFFEFKDFGDRETCREIIVKIIEKLKEQRSIEQVTESVSEKSATEIITDNVGELNLIQLECKIKILKGNSALGKLHIELVIGSVLTEDEFWAIRKNLLDEAVSITAKQQTGLPSTMLAYVQPVSDSKNKVVYQITPEIIYEIFTEKPVVHQAFLMNVPQKMNEKEFWNKYFEAERLYRKNDIALIKAQADEDEQLSIFLEEDDILSDEVRWKIRKVDPTVDMVADYADDYTHLPGHGILWDGNKDIVNMDDNKPRRTLFQDLNRHAVVVLEGRNLDSELSNAKAIAEALARIKQAEMKAETADEVTEQTRLAKAYNMTKIDDLQTPPDLLYAALYIKDSHQYFDSLHIDSTTSPRMKDSCGKINVGQFDPKQFFASLGQQVSEIKNQGLEDPVIDPDVAIMRLSTIQELLKQFWASYPLTTSNLIDKGRRLKDAMTERYKKLQVMEESIESEFGGKHSLLVQPVFEALDMVFAHLERRSQ